MWSHRHHPEIVLLALVIPLLAACADPPAPAPSPTAAAPEKAAAAVPAPPPPPEESPAPEPPPPAERVLLIIIDTLRADGLGSYGYEEETTPTLDRVAAEGVLFESFRAASPWTAPSFGTMFTGVAPSVHKAGSRVGPRSRDAVTIMGNSITAMRDDLPTLAQLMAPAVTGAVMNNSFLHPQLGYAKGFAHYDFKTAGLSRCRRADEVTRLGLDWLREHGEQPFLFVLHYFDPHMNYDPPAEYRRKFARGPAGRIKVPFSEHSAARKGELNPSPAEKAFVRGLYNGEVRFVDDQIGVLLEGMGELGLTDNTWIVVTADHGEEIFDHGSFDHGHRYEDEVVRVPLIIRAPGGKWRAGTRVAASTSHADLPATILALAGRQVPEHFEGRSLVPLMTGEQDAHRPAYIEENIYWKPRRAYFDGRYKLIADVEGDRATMYDLQEDPGEQQRLASDHPQRAALVEAMAERRAALDRAARGKSSRQEKLPEDVVESLRSLGYVE